MAAKRIAVSAETGRRVYLHVLRLSDGAQLDAGTGAFAAVPSSAFLLLAESQKVKGLYEASESRTVWTDGAYVYTLFLQAGAAASPILDAPALWCGAVQVRNDAEVTEAVLFDNQATLLSNAATIIASLSTISANVTAILAAVTGSFQLNQGSDEAILKKLAEIQEKLRLLTSAVEKQAKIKV